MVPFTSVGFNISGKRFAMLFERRKKRTIRAASDFIETLANRVDSGYRVFIHEIIQIFADAGMTFEEIELFTSNENTKIHFLVGECGAQMIASVNLFGEKNGEALCAEIVRQMNELTVESIGYKSARDVWQVYDHCKQFPLDYRTTVVFFVAQCVGLGGSDALTKIGESEMFRMLVNSTAMSDGIAGVAKEISGRHNLA